MLLNKDNATQYCCADRAVLWLNPLLNNLWVRECKFSFHISPKLNLYYINLSEKFIILSVHVGLPLDMVGNKIEPYLPITN